MFDNIKDILNHDLNLILEALAKFQIPSPHGEEHETAEIRESAEKQSETVLINAYVDIYVLLEGEIYS